MQRRRPKSERAIHTQSATEALFVNGIVKASIMEVCGLLPALQSFRTAAISRLSKNFGNDRPRSCFPSFLTRCILLFSSGMSFQLTHVGRSQWSAHLLAPPPASAPLPAHFSLFPHS